MKNTIINEIIEVEGGYGDDPSDSGGETNYGITVAVARENGYDGDMEDLPKHVAFDIYSKRYWDSVKGDDLLYLSPDIAREVVDTGINGGVSGSSKLLQRALNVLNVREDLYSDIIVDGNIGPGTIGALTEYLEHRPDYILVRMLNCLQGAFYVELAERREKDEKFIYGWFKNRVVV